MHRLIKVVNGYRPFGHLAAVVCECGASIELAGHYELSGDVTPLAEEAIANHRAMEEARR